MLPKTCALHAFPSGRIQRNLLECKSLQSFGGGFFFAGFALLHGPADAQSVRTQSICQQACPAIGAKASWLLRRRCGRDGGGGWKNDFTKASQKEAPITVDHKQSAKKTVSALLGLRVGRRATHC